MVIAAARWVLVTVTVSLVAAVPQAAEQEDSLTAGLKVAFRAYQQCEQHEDAFSCLKLRALKSLDRALKQDRITLVDGLSLVQSPEGSRALTEDPPAEVDESSLPQDAGAKQDKLDELLSDRVARFLSSHSLQLDVPRYLMESRQLPLSSFVEEGRRKGGLGGGGGGGMKKYGGLMMMGLMMKSGLMAMMYKGVALLAGKALMVAKIALVLSAVLGLSKLFGGGGGGEEKTTYEIVKHPHVSHAYTHSSSHEFLGHGGGGGGGGGGHYDTSGGGGGASGGHGGWGRSLDTPYPHLMAYRGQLPEAARPSEASAQDDQRATA